MKVLNYISLLLLAFGIGISTVQAQLNFEEDLQFEENIGSTLDEMQASSVGGRNWGIGVRFGIPTALSLKHYTGANAWELNVGSNIDDRILLQLHYLINNDIAVSSNWKWYYGLGPQIQIGDNNDHDHGHHDHDHETLDLGLDGVVGTEYRFSNAPFAVFLDLILFVEVIDDPLDIDLQSGLGVRYEF